MRVYRIGVLLTAFTLASCSGLRRDGARPPVTDVAAAVAVDAYRSMIDMGEVIVIRAPKLLFLDLPAWVFYHGPRSLWLSASSTRTRVEALMAILEGESSDEERVEAAETLRDETGLPLADAAAWSAWWREARDRPEESWRSDYVARCLADLVSEDFFVRQAADDHLRELSGQDVGFDAKATAQERAEAIESWRAWAGSDGGGR